MKDETETAGGLDHAHWLCKKKYIMTVHGEEERKGEGMKRGKGRGRQREGERERRRV